ncbi:MAG: hypothetical protein AABW79_00770 [Nanoarchaeota archaeon]
MSVTTIKISHSTKERIDKLKKYRRETYDEVMHRLLEILNLCKSNPDAARGKLMAIDKVRKEEFN